jgi:DNA-binding MarR family transcriptional regulator/N-acetylglutamate synthase-like GNAT family acetyltransferase
MEDQIAAVRDFTRFYTSRMGVLKEGLLDSDLPLPLARIVYELAQQGDRSGRDLAASLSLDAAYVSRLLKRLESKGLIERKPSRTDGREKLHVLTPQGQTLFAELDRRSREEVADMLAGLNAADQARLTEAMTTVQGLLTPATDAADDPFIIRPHRPGDIGWVISRHGAIYAQEFGWDISFEALVAEIAGQFLRDFQPEWEQCWIAERHGQNVGSVFVVRKSADVAQLRMLIIDPSARGHHIGERLVETVIGHARAKGFSVLTLWTNDCLHAARRIYQKFGFELVDEAPHHSFGVDLVGQNWDLKL